MTIKPEEWEEKLLKKLTQTSDYLRVRAFIKELIEDLENENKELKLKLGGDINE